MVDKIVETVKKPFSKIKDKPVLEKQAGGASPKDSDITGGKTASDQPAQKQPLKRSSPKTKAGGESYRPDPAQKKRLPFGGKGRPRRPSKKEQQAIAEQKRLDELDKDIDSMSASPVQPPQDGIGQQFSGVSSAMNGFFYTDEVFVTRFEDKEILQYIRRRFPEYVPNSENQFAARHVVLDMLSDSRFMSGLLERYDMNVFDFFKLMFRLDPELFRGAFI